MPRRLILRTRANLLAALLLGTVGSNAAVDFESSQVVATPPTPGSTATEGAAQAFLEAINELRSREQSPPLQLSRSLSDAARILLDRAGSASPTIEFNGSARLTRDDLLAAGYDPSQWAEGLASSPGEPIEIVAFWRLTDPRSFGNFLDSQLRDFGLATDSWTHPPLYALVAATTRSEIHRPILEGLSDLEAVRQQLLDRVNQERRQRGLPRLHLSDDLSSAAQGYANRMMSEGFYGHISPQGDTVLERIEASGYRPELTGENLASGPRTARQVMDGWMASKGHRDNILDRRFRDVGFGVSAADADGELKVLWVQCFGRRRP